MPTISDTALTNPIADALDANRLGMWKIHDEARRLVKIENLPTPYRELAKTIVKLSDLRPHRIVGESEAEDFEKLIADLEHITLAVDPLILAYGEYAQSNAPGRFETKLFTNQLRGALEGNATFELESAAKRIAEDIAHESDAPSIDPNDEHRTHPGRY